MTWGTWPHGRSVSRQVQVSQRRRFHASGSAIGGAERSALRLLPVLLRMNSAIGLLVFAGFAVAGDVAVDRLVDPLAKYRSNESRHGLYEIRGEAKDFLDRQNAREGTDWRPIDPDIRIVVDRCAIPLRSKWTIFESRKSVLVSCGRTAATASQRRWYLPVSIGSDRLQRNFDIHEAAQAFVRSEASRDRAQGAGYPSTSTMVYKCAVPLTVEWRKKDVGRSVDVICTRTVDSAPKPREWRIQVPIT